DQRYPRQSKASRMETYSPQDNDRDGSFVEQSGSHQRKNTNLQRNQKNFLKGLTNNSPHIANGEETTAEEDRHCPDCPQKEDQQTVETTPS
ncbi:hypothetical protein PROFUN_16520, partial [Planoprotostelium fungivorum]